MKERTGAVMLWDTAAVALPYGILIVLAVVLGGQPWSLVAPLAAIKAAGWQWPTWLRFGIAVSIAAGGLFAMFNPFRVKDVYGDAHFATEPEIKKMGLRAGRGLILGMTLSCFLGLKSGRYLRLDKPLSVLVYAPPGTGKTMGLIVPSLLACDNSCITLDLKGEIYELTAKARSHFSRIIRFEPGAAGSTRWNPLSKKELPDTWEKVQIHVGRVAESIIPTKAEDDDKQYWPREARSMFCFWALFLIYRDGETNFGQILKESIGSGPQEAIAEVLDEYEDVDGFPERVRLEGEPFANMGDKQFEGVFGTFKSNMRLFLDPVVTANTAASDFSLRDLRRDCTSVYLVVSNPDLRRLNPILTLFFELATLTFTSHVPTEDEWRVTFFLDEFVRLAKMQEILTMPAIGRGFGINAFYVCQSFSQLVGIYTQAGADELRNTASYHIVFAQNEQKIAEDISRSIGNRTRTKITRSTQKGSLLKSVSESEEGVPLIKSQDVMSMKPGEILVLAQGHFETPIKAHACFWFKDRTLTRLVKRTTMNLERVSLPAVAAPKGSPIPTAPARPPKKKQEDPESMDELHGLDVHEVFDEEGI